MFNDLPHGKIFNIVLGFDEEFSWEVDLKRKYTSKIAGKYEQFPARLEISWAKPCDLLNGFQF
jgi:hypothetical protein